MLRDEEVDVSEAATAVEPGADPLDFAEVENAEPLRFVPRVAQLVESQHRGEVDDRARERRDGNAVDLRALVVLEQPRAVRSLRRL